MHVCVAVCLFARLFVFACGGVFVRSVVCMCDCLCTMSVCVRLLVVCSGYRLCDCVYMVCGCLCG